VVNSAQLALVGSLTCIFVNTSQQALIATTLAGAKQRNQHKPNNDAGATIISIQAAGQDINKSLIWDSKPDSRNSDVAHTPLHCRNKTRTNEISKEQILQ
jgi:hypothetical protein